MRLLPQYVKSEISWLPYVWLVWLLYFGASAFFIYAAATAGFIGETGLAIAIVLAMEAIFGAIVWVFHLPIGAWIPIGILIAAIGVMNIQHAKRILANARLRLAHEEIEHLAKTAERERIARDLHDVLGHTLSVIILKSELAGKLMDRDPRRAGNEIREVEQISRQALSEVRDTIRGYRSQGLEAELARAKSTLETAGVAVKLEAARVALPALQEGVLSMAVREAVTNVVRHAHARTCTLQLEQRNGSCHLEIEDDGRGGFENEGNGLRGMRERVEMLGGNLTRNSQAGTRLTITVPLKEVTPKSEGVN